MNYHLREMAELGTATILSIGLDLAGCYCTLILMARHHGPLTCVDSPDSFGHRNFTTAGQALAHTD
jgi:hypothetical protein